jgi:hypothetical protein
MAAELASVSSYYASRIAAARSSLNPADAAAVIRNLKNEEALAMRAVIEKWQAYFLNAGNGKTSAPKRPRPSKLGIALQQLAKR